MRVLVVGGGGREHTYIWKIAQSPMVDKVYCVPGNAGIAQIAECRNIGLSGDFSALADFVQAEGIDLTVVGTETPLAEGLVDQFAARGLRVFGPSMSAAELESSKSFAKNLMSKYNIPTAEYQVFHNPEEAIAYVKHQRLRLMVKKVGAPIVVKASGLAAGKGVLICQTENEAIQAVQNIMVEKVFGTAGDTVVIEEFLQGEEATFTALTDGETVLPMVTSQDHKPVFDGDRGLNTGGMGAYSPAPVVTEEMHHKIMKEIVEPTIRGMANEGRKFVGILYVGLMIDAEGPKVLEFNCRLGDPEAQVILPRLESDLIPALEACIDGILHQIQLEWKSESAVCVVMASGGYPQQHEKGKVITGLMEAEAIKDVVVFHAGTATNENGDIITNGGRVLGVTALGRDIKTAIDRAYEAVGKIHFDKVHYRRDIGHRAIKR